MILAHFFHLSLSGLDGRTKPLYHLIPYQATFVPQGKIAYLRFRTETPTPPKKHLTWHVIGKSGG